MAWAPGAGAGARARSPSPSPPPSQSPSPPPPAAFLRGAGQPCQRLRVGSPHKAKHELRAAVVLLDGRRLEVLCDARVSTVDDVLECVSRSAALQGRPVALATSLCGELVFPPPALKLSRLARLAPVAWAPRAPAPAAAPALAVTLLVRVWLLLPALPALSDASGRRLLFLELRRRAAEGRLRGSRAQLRALSALARRADALREDHAHQREAAEAAARRAEDAFAAAAARLPLAGAHVLDAVWVQSSAGCGPRAVSLAVAADALAVLSAGTGAGAGAPSELLRLPWPCVRSLRHSARAFRVAASPAPAPAPAQTARLRKLKFYLPHKKSMFLFHLASIHHQMYLKLQNHLTTILPSRELEVMNYAQETIENRSNDNKRMHLYEEDSCKENNMFHKIASSSELCPENYRVDHETEGLVSPIPQEAFVLKSSAISSNEKFNVLQETLTESLIEKFEEISFVDERLLCTVRIERDVGGSLGLQVECGNDGGIYVRCCLQHSNNIQKGDRIMAVDGQSLMHLKFTEALNFLKSAGHTVELILSRQNIPNTHNPSTLKLSSPLPSFSQREPVSPLRELQTHSPLKE